MDASSLERLGRTTGLCGIALAILVLIFRDMMKLQLWNTGLTAPMTFAVIVSMMVLTFGIATIGVIAWLIGKLSPPRTPVTPLTLGVLAAMFGAILLAVFFICDRAQSLLPGEERVAQAPDQRIPEQKPEKTFNVCHGELEERCRKHPYDIWEECSARNGVGGADPNVSCLRLCGKALGPGLCTGVRQPGTSAESGNRCGYSWFQVRCH
jgi:hypothetical protein